MNNKLLTQIDILEKEKRELEAQLARCVVELKNAGCWLDSLNDLPKTVHLDAKILGWAEEWATGDGFTSLCVEELREASTDHPASRRAINLIDAVRAKMESIK